MPTDPDPILARAQAWLNGDVPPDFIGPDFSRDLSDADTVIRDLLRLLTETQQEKLIEQRVIGHGEGQEHALADVQPRIAALEAALSTCQAERDEPNIWKCETCGFVVTKCVLRAVDGAVGIDRGNVEDICPNDGTSLRRQTYKESAESAGKWAVDCMERLSQAEERHAASEQRWHDRCEIAEAEVYGLCDRVHGLEASLAACQQGWQPGASVPQKGPVLVTNGILTWIAHHPWMSRRQGGITHWMPLPAPPAAIPASPPRQEETRP